MRIGHAAGRAGEDVLSEWSTEDRPAARSVLEVVCFTNDVTSSALSRCPADALEAGLFNPLITATAGWSEAVEERAKRLLRYQVGTEGDGAPVTVQTMLARCGFDPVASARFLMVIPPLVAVCELTKTIAGFQIDGMPCPDPAETARAALSFAGRAVAMHELHPERRFVAGIIASLLENIRPGRPSR